MTLNGIDSPAMEAAAAVVSGFHTSQDLIGNTPLLAIDRRLRGARRAGFL
jgi:hypothetical protein